MFDLPPGLVRDDAPVEDTRSAAPEKPKFSLPPGLVRDDAPVAGPKMRLPAAVAQPPAAIEPFSAQSFPGGIIPQPPRRPASLDTGANVPETPETLKAQADQLTKGNRAVQMFPLGTETPEPPDGMKVLNTPRGTFHYDPDQTTPAYIARMSRLGRENELLGLGPYSKADVDANGGASLAVTERQPDGTEVKAATGNPATAPAQIAAMEAGKTPGNTVQPETPASVIAGRMPEPPIYDQDNKVISAQDNPNKAVTPEEYAEAGKAFDGKIKGLDIKGASKILDQNNAIVQDANAKQAQIEAEFKAKTAQLSPTKSRMDNIVYNAAVIEAKGKFDALKADMDKQIAGLDVKGAQDTLGKAKAAHDEFQATINNRPKDAVVQVQREGQPIYDQDGNVTGSTQPIAPQGTLSERVMSALNRAKEGVYTGLGAQELGFTSEDIKKYPFLAYPQWQWPAKTLDTLLRLPGGIIGGAAGATGGAVEGVTGDSNLAGQADRMVQQALEFGMTPGAHHLNVPVTRIPEGVAPLTTDAFLRQADEAAARQRGLTTKAEIDDFIQRQDALRAARGADVKQIAGPEGVQAAPTEAAPAPEAPKPAPAAPEPAPIEATTPGHAHEIVQSIADQAPWTPEQRAVVREYGAMETNDELKEFWADPAKVNTLKSASIPAPHDLVVFRGGPRGVDINTYNGDLMSTSTDPAWAETHGGVRYGGEESQERIVIRKGTPIIPVDHPASEASEKEILIPKGVRFDLTAPEREYTPINGKRFDQTTREWEASSAAPAPAPEPPKSFPESDVLRAAGYSDEDIATMSPSERAAEAKQAEPVGTRTNPVKVEAPEDIAPAVEKVNTKPSEAQKEAGNYKKGHIDFDGLPITIENPKGSVRSGIDPDTGKPWENTLPGHYGYIKRSEGADGDHVDVIVGDQPPNGKVFVVDQRNPTTRAFDEHKSIVGVDSIADAARLYHKMFSDGSGVDRRMNIHETTTDGLKDWLKTGDMKKPFASPTKADSEKAGNVTGGNSPDSAELISGTKNPPPSVDKPAPVSDSVAPTVRPENPHTMDLEQFIKAHRNRLQRTKGTRNDISVQPVGDAKIPWRVDQKFIHNGHLKAGNTFEDVLKDVWEKNTIAGRASVTAAKEQGKDEARARADERRARDIARIGEPTINSMAERLNELMSGVNKSAPAMRDARAWVLDNIIDPASTGVDAARVLTGTDNEKTKKVFEEFTGKKLPKTIEARKAFLKENAPFTFKGEGEPLEKVEQPAKPTPVSDVSWADAKPGSVLADGSTLLKKGIRTRIEANKLAKPFGDGAQVILDGATKFAVVHPPENTATSVAVTPKKRIKPAKDASPVSLVAFLRANGGVKNQGGELTNYIRQHPGLVNNKSGMTIDEARKVAAEAGYLGADTDRAMAETWLNDLLNALANHPHYSDLDEEAVARMKGPETLERLLREHEDKIRTELRDLGLPADFDPKILRRAAKIMHADGGETSPTDALEQAVIHGVEETPEHRAEVNLDGEIPWDDHAKISPTSTSETGKSDKASDGAGAKAKGPGEESEGAGRHTEPARAADDQAKPEGGGSRQEPAETGRGGVDKTEAGNQTVIPGAEKISDKALADKKADAPLKAKVPQKDAGGMFGDSMDQADLMDTIAKTPKKTDLIDKHFGDGAKMVHSVVQPFIEGQIDYRTARQDLADFIDDGHYPNAKAKAAARQRGLEGLRDLKDEIQPATPKVAASTVPREPAKTAGPIEDFGEKGIPKLASVEPAPKTRIEPPDLDIPGKAPQDFMDTAKAKQNRRIVMDVINRVLPPDAVRMEFSKNLFVDKVAADASGMPEANGAKAGGLYTAFKHIIAIALDGNNPKRAAYHEGVHAAQDLGLFTPQENRALSSPEIIATMRKHVSERFGPEIAETMPEHELRAYSIGDAAEALDEGRSVPWESNIFNRIGARFLRLLKHIRDALMRRMSDPDLTEISKAYHRGDFANREPGETQLFKRDAEGKFVLGEDGLAQFASGDNGGNNPPRLPVVEDNGMPYKPRKSTLSDKAAKAWDKFRLSNIRENFQDFNSPIEDMQGLLQERFDREFPADRDLYKAKRLMPGRIAAEMIDAETRFVKPLTDQLANNGLELHDLDNYLLARHAPERNALMDERDPGNMGKGSGITNEQAERMAEQLYNEGKVPALEEAARIHDNMREFGLERAVSSGLMSDEAAQQWREQYAFHASLKGWDDPSLMPEEADQIRMGGKMNIRGSESQAALGRSSISASPTVNAIGNLYRTISRAERNTVLKAGWRMFKSMPADDIKDIVRLDKPKMVRRLDPNSGMVRLVPERAPNANTVELKIGGVPHYMNFESKALADTINRTAAEALPGALKLVQDFGNLSKAAWTHLNPEFLLGHFLARYPIETALNAGENKGASRYSIKGYPGGPAFRAIRAVEKMPPEDRAGLAERANSQDATEAEKWQHFYNESREAGALMDFRSMDDLDTIANRIKQNIAHVQGGKVRNAVGYMRDLYHLTNRITSAADNALRLAIYRHAREQIGLSPKEAAMKAREASVDFAVRGKQPNYASIWRPFFNVGVQTGARAYRGMKRSQRLRKVVGGMVGFGAVLAAWNYIAGGNDENGTPYFEKISPYTRGTNLVVAIPGMKDGKGKPYFLTIPFPYNYMAPLSVGEMLSSFMMKAAGVAKQKLGHMVSHTAHTVIEAALPVGQEASWMGTFTPQVINPFLHVAMNENTWGSPVHNAHPKKGVAQSEQGFKNTAAPWGWIARGLNHASGGDKNTSGYLDTYPENYKETLGVLTSAFERIGSRGASAAADGENASLTDIPLLHRFIAGGDRQFKAADRAKYFEDRNEAQGVYDAYKRMVKDKDFAGAQKLKQENGPEIDKAKAFENVEKLRKNAEKRKEAIRTSPRTDAEKSMVINQIDTDMAARMKKLAR